jgi:hypothetical protein
VTAAVLLRGAAAIGAHLGQSAGWAQHQHQTRALPTFAIGGTPYATTTALDEWRELFIAGKLPTK